MKLLHTAFLLGLVGIAGPLWAQERMLHAFETPADLQTIEASTATCALTGQNQGKQALQVTFNPGVWPQINFNYATPLDARGYYGIAFDMANPGEETLEYGVRLDDDPRSDGDYHCRKAMATIGPREKSCFVVPLLGTADPMTVGMRALPMPRINLPGAKILFARGIGPFAPEHIIRLQFFMHLPAAPKTLRIDNIRLIPLPKEATQIDYTDLNKIVDAFGQYSREDWPGKLHSLADFTARKQAEDEALRARPALPDRDPYGGWARGPKLKATGFFRTEKIRGKWWLVDPAGHLFFSVGIDNMEIPAECTLTAGREYLFSWLPEKEDPLSACVSQRASSWGPVRSGAAMNFYQANLMRKYGDAYQQAFLNRALRRLPSWGFNTIGNWSDSRFYANGKVPYVLGPQLSPANVPTVDRAHAMVDPFDPRFITELRRVIGAERAERLSTDPYCIGYFIGNEEHWGADISDRDRYLLPIDILTQPAETSAAKRAFLTELQGKYPDIAKLNTAWGTKLAGWDALRAAYTLSDPLTAGCKADLSAFLKTFARQYFRTAKAELKRVDPNHLFLGGRFVSWCPREVVEAAAEYCDVVSYNIYEARIDPRRWEFLNELDAPFLIGEFHFGAIDRGMFAAGMCSASSQEDRAKRYIDYVHSVLDHPAFVGCHWFQYNDQPLTGRFSDGESYSVGFVSVTDTPYPELVQAARRVHQEIYTRRYGKAAK